MDTSRKWMIGIALIAILGFSGIAYAKKHTQQPPAVSAVATFYPMAEFVRQVGGNRVGVTTLTKPGAEPHDFDPTPKQLAQIYDAKLFVYNGAGLEPWVNKITKDLDASDVFRVDASYKVPLQHKDASDTGNDSPTDPHIWMDPVLAMKEVDNVRLGLIAVDPSHAQYYVDNAIAYTKKLEALNTAFKKGLANCQSKDIVTSHQAFTYLAKRYGLNAVGIAGLSPDDEPSPQKLAQVADFVKQNNVHYIFFETLVSPKLSQTIASETGARTIAFNPLEGLTTSETKAGKNYISVQQDNLKALQTALGCNQ
ncbi:MAG TPA: metal ABC transporter substrate-binding protein [Candidatus Saccharimonadales bacterium]|nr:metal ABC transporter substrate-binding protein [Candidatus Saccharimonadales bacterium]